MYTLPNNLWYYNIFIDNLKQFFKLILLFLFKIYYNILRGCDNLKKMLLFILLLTISINVNAIDIKENKIKVSLNKCIDGDTAKFNYQNEVIKVRFLAIDAPELEHENQKEEPYAYDAKIFTCEELKQAKNIYLEFDNNSDKQDKYERYLTWVFVDNELLQEKIVENGYAKVAYLYDDYKYTKILNQKERIAKRHKRGIWSNEKDNSYLLILLPFAILLILLLLLIGKK